jgi:hypothetical protein
VKEINYRGLGVDCSDLSDWKVQRTHLAPSLLRLLAKIVKILLSSTIRKGPEKGEDW